METQGNPFVRHLNRYTTVSSEHEAAFDEYICEEQDDVDSPLSIATKTQEFVRSRFAEGEHVSIILTGNAGDGKTYLCRQIIESFTGNPLHSWPDPDWEYTRNGKTLHVIKDLSEVSETEGAKTLAHLNHSLEQGALDTAFLIAANEGRLRALLSHNKLPLVKKHVDSQLRDGPKLDSPHLIVLNLNRAATSSYIPQVIDWLTVTEHWEACDACPAQSQCPIHFNAKHIARKPSAERLQQLYQIIEHLGEHVTIRDMLIHLAYTVTGGLSCEEVIEKTKRYASWEPHKYVYYNNVWGEMAEEAFRRKALVVHFLRRLDVGVSSIFDLDDLIINGRLGDREAHKERDDLFDESLDLGFKTFRQDRTTYLYGDAVVHKSGPPALLQWLPHVRRKLYFEWSREYEILRLFPFLFLPSYFELLKDPLRSPIYHAPIVLGLNRAFSGLFLSDSSHLYVTSQYAHSAEQPVSIVRLKIPFANVRLQVKKDTDDALDRNEAALFLVIAPPPFVYKKPVEWPLDLLHFEYLMRRAQGATPDVLAAECELAIRQLRDELLASFEQEPGSEGDGNATLEIDFFTVVDNRYELKTIDLQDGNRIRTR